MIEKSEIKYLLMSNVLIAVLMIITNVKSINTQISNLNPIWQFLILNLGFYTTVFLIIKGVSLGKDAKHLFKGALGSILAFISLSIISSSYQVSIKDGLIDGGLFSKSSTDYFFGYIYNHYLGISGLPLVILVYFVTFSILFILGALLIKNFIKNQI